MTLRDVRHNAKGISIEIEPQSGVTYKTEFIGTCAGYDAMSEPVKDEKGQLLRTTRRYSKDVGRVLATVEGASAKYAYNGDKLYVRARIISSKQKEDVLSPDEKVQAWTQPMVTGLK